MALDNCMSNTMAWYAEKAYRHYSATYHTPLHQAREILTPFEVIKIMMEDETVDLPIEELQDLRTKILDASPDRAYMGNGSEDSAPAELSDDDWIAMQDKIVAEQEAKAKKAAPETQLQKVTKNLGDAANTLADAVKSVQEQLGRDLEAEINKPLKFDPEK